jgi:8-oxo-dGTP diphosphatase
VGGKLHAGELPLPACLREVREETGYVLPTARFAGILTWRGFEIEPGGLYIFTAPAPAGEPRAGPEGELRCHPRAWVFSHPQVVNNIHHFGPAALNGAAPIVYHFDYAEGAIAHVELFPLPVGGVVA